MDKSFFVVLDIETTGLSRYCDAITEFCGVRVRWDGSSESFVVVDEFSTLVNPERKIPRFITRLTGIDGHMVRDAPVFSDVASNIREFIGDDVVVAHNATFDYNFLDYNFKRSGCDGISNDALCTCKLSRRVVPALSSYKLGSVCDYFCVDNERAHRAMGDALATKDVFGHLYCGMRLRDVLSLDDALKFQKSKIVKG